MDKRQGTTKHGPGLVDVLVLLGFCTVIGLAGFGIFFGGRAVVERIEAEFDARVATRVAAGVKAEIRSRLTLTDAEIRQIEHDFNELRHYSVDNCFRHERRTQKERWEYENCRQKEFDRKLGFNKLLKLGLRPQEAVALISVGFDSDHCVP